MPTSVVRLSTLGYEAQSHQVTFYGFGLDEFGLESSHEASKEVTVLMR
jgi:hypothetical protein